MNSVLRRRPRAMQVTGAAIGLAVVMSGVVVSASPAAAAPAPWESQSGIYHYFTVPKSSVPSNTCGNSTGAGAELEGNIGPSGTWAAVGLDASGQNCVADIGPMKPGLYYYQYVATMPDRSKQVFRNPDSFRRALRAISLSTFDSSAPESLASFAASTRAEKRSISRWTTSSRFKRSPFSAESSPTAADTRDQSNVSNGFGRRRRGLESSSFPVMRPPSLESSKLLRLFWLHIDDSD